jgi:gamma-glutamyltranspeptidase / glutathione hydrolase
MNGKRPIVSSMNGIVAAAHPHAAAAGAHILAQGGTAFDAAVATAAALNVVEPFMSSLAGQGLATCWIAKERRVRTLNFVPSIPLGFPADRFREREQLARGPMSVGVPGNLAGWAELMRAHGRMTFEQVFAPAIALARDGYPVTNFYVYETAVNEPELRRYPALWEAWAKTYTDGTGRISRDHVVRQPALAATLEAIARNGAGHLYEGGLGRAVVAHLEATGGCITMADLAAVKAEWHEPASVRYRDLVVNVPPPPCEGFQFLIALRILDGFDLKSLAPNGVEHLDTVWRAIRLSAGERIAHNNPSPSRLIELLSDANIERLRARVRDGKPVDGPTEQWTAPMPPGSLEHHTTSFSVADREGNVICITQSLGSAYGAAVMVPGTGLMLNNFLYWADVQPSSPNRSAPGGKLPMCVSPSLSLRDGVPVLALGTPGSYGIKQTQTQAMVQRVDFGLDIQEAIEAPRVRLWDGRLVTAESRFDRAVLDALSARGHEIELGDAFTMKAGGMQGIAIDPATGLKIGGCDPRRDGYVVPA